MCCGNAKKLSGCKLCEHCNGVFHVEQDQDRAKHVQCVNFVNSIMFHVEQRLPGETNMK